MLWPEGASQVAIVVKNPFVNTGGIRDAGVILGLGRSTGGEQGNPLQYSWPENLHRQKSLTGYQSTGSQRAGAGHSWSEMYLPRLIDQSLNFQCDYHWRQGLWGCMKVKWHHKGDLSQREVVPLWGEDETPGSSLYTHTGERPWEGTVRRWPSARQEERSHQKPTVMGLILDFDLQKCKKINFFGLSHPVCGILLWQAE